MEDLRERQELSQKNASKQFNLNWKKDSITTFIIFNVEDMDMEIPHINTETITSAGNLKWGQMVIESVLKNFGGGTFFDQTPEDVYVDCEVSDVEEEDEN